MLTRRFGIGSLVAVALVSFCAGGGAVGWWLSRFLDASVSSAEISRATVAAASLERLQSGDAEGASAILHSELQAALEFAAANEPHLSPEQRTNAERLRGKARSLAQHP